jgi:hypothetical protein
MLLPLRPHQYDGNKQKKIDFLSPYALGKILSNQRPIKVKIMSEITITIKQNDI